VEISSRCGKKPLFAGVLQHAQITNNMIVQAAFEEMMRLMDA
jgi:hypothetical protein